MNLLTDILTKYYGKQLSGDCYKIQCPASHNHANGDKNPSCSLTVKNNKLLIHCHAGCEQEEVISILKSEGLWHTTSDPKSNKGTGKIESELIPISDPRAEIGQKYLRSRINGIEIGKLPNDIQFNLSVPYYDDGIYRGNYSALEIKIVDDIKQVIYLSDDGKKANVAAPKKIKGKYSGHYLTLGVPESSIAICEGIETALAVWHATNLPVACCFSANNLEKFTPAHDKISSIHIFADKDASEAGEKAAAKAAKRLLGQDYDVLYSEL